MACCLVAATALAGCATASGQIEPGDEQLYSLLLENPGTDGRYTIIKGQTRLGLSPDSASDETKLYVKDNLEIPGYDASVLLDVFFEANRNSIPLPIESDLTKGYLVDTEGSVDAYFKKDGGGWDKLYEDNPQVRGILTISVPVHDKDRGIVLVYMGVQGGPLLGSGWITAFKLAEGELTEVGRVMMWIS